MRNNDGWWNSDVYFVFIAGTLTLGIILVLFLCGNGYI